MPNPRPFSATALANMFANSQLPATPATPAGQVRGRGFASLPPDLAPYASCVDYDDLLAAMRKKFSPATPMQELFIECLAVGFWGRIDQLRAEAANKTHREELAQDPSVPPEPALSDYNGPDEASVSLRVDLLSAALSDMPRLRRHMVALYPVLQDDNDEEILITARRTLADDYDLLEAYQNLYVSDRNTRFSKSRPPLDETLLLTRHEAALENKRLLDQLWKENTPLALWKRACPLEREGPG